MRSRSVRSWTRSCGSSTAGTGNDWLRFSDNNPGPWNLRPLRSVLGVLPRNRRHLLHRCQRRGGQRIQATTIDPMRPGSGVESGTTGFYQIEITFGRATACRLSCCTTSSGDSNLFRDQGQFLIFGQHDHGFRRSTESSPPRRSPDGQDGDIPHMGPVRKTPKLNAEDLVPGVVIANNVLAFNGNPPRAKGAGSTLPAIQTRDRADRRRAVRTHREQHRFTAASR